jgi:spore coat polysaccharide biosynthesis predicted glycosyltransferase SpsG
MPKSTLIITRADAAFGQGHLARSLTLAAALRSEGAQVETLLLGDEGALQHARMRREPVVFFPSWELRYAMRRALLAQLLCELYPKQRPKLAVFDMYDFADTYWARRFFGEQLPDTSFIGLDIYKRVEQPQRPERSEYWPVAFSVIINSLLAPFGSQESEAGGVRTLSGTDYLILTPELQDAPKWTPPVDKAAPIPVLLSGSVRDARDLTQIKPSVRIALRALSELPEFQFIVLSAYPDALASLCGANVEAKPLLTPAKFYRVLSSSPCAILSAGVTLYEAAHLGVPAAIVPVASHERATAQKFADAGYGMPVNLRGNALASLRDVLTELAQPDVAHAQSAAGRKLVDGQGLERVLAVLREMMRH